MDWSKEQISEWISELNLRHAPPDGLTLTGEAFLGVSDSQLKEMGFKAIGDRKKILQAVQELRGNAEDKKEGSKDLAAKKPSVKVGQLLDRRVLAFEPESWKAWLSVTAAPKRSHVEQLASDIAKPFRRQSKDFQPKDLAKREYFLPTLEQEPSHIILVGSTGAGKSTFGNWLFDFNRPLEPEQQQKLNEAIRHEHIALGELRKNTRKENEAQFRSKWEDAVTKRCLLQREELKQPFVVGQASGTPTTQVCKSIGILEKVPVYAQVSRHCLWFGLL